MNKLYDEIDAKNKEIEELKTFINLLKDQVGCLIRDGIEKNNEIDNLKQQLEEAKFFNNYLGD